MTSLQTAGVFLCAHDCREVSTLQTGLQTATAVVSSRELVGVRMGRLYVVVEGIPTAMLL